MERTPQLHQDKAIILQPSSSVLVNGWGTAFSWFLAYFFFSRYFLERILPRIHRKEWPKMNIPDQRSFTVHHHWIVVKFICISGAWPYINIMFRGKELAEPLFQGTHITNADFLSVLYMAIMTSFAWEICYRCKISIVSLIHHAGAIILAAWQLSGEVRSVPYTSIVPPEGSFIDTTDNDQQFKIIMTYGVFEVVFESWMHFCCIFHKRLAGQYMKTANLWMFGGLWVLFGSLTELVVMILLWRHYWHDWSPGFRAAMIVLHFAFMSAQLHGARIGLMLVRKYRRKAAEEAAAKADGGALGGGQDSSQGGTLGGGSPALTVNSSTGPVSGEKNGLERDTQGMLGMMPVLPVETKAGMAVAGAMESVLTPMTEKGVGDLEEEVKGR